MRELNPREKMCFIQHHTAATSQSRVRNDHYSPRSLPMPLKLHQASKGTALVTPSPPYETSAHLWLTTPTLSHHFIYASGCVCVCPNFGCVWLLVTPWTVDYQLLCSWPEFCSGLPFPSSGYLPNPGTEPTFILSPALAGGFFTTSLGSPGCFWLVMSKFYTWW